MSDQLAKAKRETGRWRILKVLDSGRPHSVDESLLLNVLNDAQVALTPSELRRELDYLRDRKLLEVEVRDGQWCASLTHYGVDVVEYTVDVLPGIARPAKWA